MVYAPIIIPTLCRDRHFIRLMESLKRNSWAKYTEVYVGLDYPVSNNHKEGYNNICAYLLQDFPEFKAVHIIKRASNLGAVRNSKELRDYVLSRHDRFIRTDDDAEFSPNFLEYMNRCLDKYKNDSSVIAVTGYSYPVKWHTSESATVFKENFICPMWGTGFWRDKYYQIDNYLSSGELKNTIPHALFHNTFTRMMKRCQMEYINCCLSVNFTNTLAARTSDVAMRMYSAIHDKYIIMPTVSKVRNWGFDGSGLYCQDTYNSKKKNKAGDYPYHKQFIDQNTNFVLIEDKLCSNKSNKKTIDSFDTITIKQRLKTQIKRFVYRTTGSRIYNMIFTE